MTNAMRPSIMLSSHEKPFRLPWYPAGEAVSFLLFELEYCSQERSQTAMEPMKKLNRNETTKTARMTLPMLLAAKFANDPPSVILHLSGWSAFMTWLQACSRSEAVVTS